MKGPLRIVTLPSGGKSKVVGAPSEGICMGVRLVYTPPGTDVFVRAALATQVNPKGVATQGKWAKRTDYPPPHGMSTTFEVPHQHQSPFVSSYSARFEQEEKVTSP